MSLFTWIKSIKSRKTAHIEALENQVLDLLSQRISLQTALKETAEQLRPFREMARSLHYTTPDDKVVECLFQAGDIRKAGDAFCNHMWRY